MNIKQEDCSIRKYDGIPHRLVSLFARFLKVSNLKSRAKRLNNARYTIIQTPWAEAGNKIDCGIYAMRHMETYMGERFEWKTGFFKKLKTQLNIFRVKFCAAILTAECNQLRYENILQSNHYYQRRCSEEGRPINLTDVLKL